jgi:hypothetical protein
MTARMSALWFRKHLGGLRVRLHETNEPHFQPSAPCGVDATLTTLHSLLQFLRWPEGDFLAGCDLDGFPGRQSP